MLQFLLVFSLQPAQLFKLILLKPHLPFRLDLPNRHRLDLQPNRHKISSGIEFNTLVAVEPRDYLLPVSHLDVSEPNDLVDKPLVNLVSPGFVSQILLHVLSFNRLLRLSDFIWI